MKLLTIISLFLFSSTAAFSAESLCTNICSLKSGLKFCSTWEGHSDDDYQEHINVFYTTPSGDHIEINAYPYTKLIEVINSGLKEAKEKGSDNAYKGLQLETKNIKCERYDKVIKFVEAPAFSQFF